MHTHPLRPLRILLLAGLLASAGAVALPAAGQPAASLATAAPATPVDPYAAVDQWALAAPLQVEQSIPALASYLARGGKNDREKARAIFRWIAERISYDHDGASGGKQDDRAEAVLKTRTGVCAGYSQLFARLAKSMGLQAVVVTGWARTFAPPAQGLERYNEPSPSGVNFERHAWNAVRLDGKWHLLDCTWAGGQLLRKSGRLEWAKPFDDYHFLTPPEQFVLSHLPIDPKWQLLAQPYTRDLQEQAPILRGGYYSLGLTLKSHPMGIIQSREALTLRVSAPAGVELTADLHENGERVGGNWTLCQRSGQEYEVRVAWPRAGRYVLHLFGRKRGEPVFDQCADYRIDAQAGSSPLSEMPQAMETFIRQEGQLLGPFTGTLSMGKQHAFVISVPGAMAVSLINGGKEIPLQSRGELFSTTVPLAPGEAILAAELPEMPGINQGLLRFTVR